MSAPATRRGAASNPPLAGAYDALLVDLDGTLLDERGQVHPDNARALQELERRGGRAMIATGRSVTSARPVVEALGLATPTVVFNGAGLWCPRERRLLEERTLGFRTLERALEFGRARDLLTVLMTGDKKLSSPPRDENERVALSGLHGLIVVPREQLTAEFVMRVTYFSNGGASSESLARDVERAVALPVYMTHFPLNALPTHRASPLAVVDVHPPCRGKAEGVRALAELYGIPSARTVAIGDAGNDVPMLAAAGLAVGMQHGTPDVHAVADRLLASNEGRAIADLVEELFLS